MNIEEMMIDFLIHNATDEQIDEFFGFYPHGFTREEIEDTLAQMPDDVFEELCAEFELTTDNIEL